ncbi:hypothetical protein BAE44_0008320 [Dichanthelium oligosanthes]|uniref:Bet v I/Major latex protein domain-containing protein n=1 Tax=Dichanthelium oligosanthes TaxID=888268 RepID=A0A1E5VZZ4_9POAL|nr:hypothetical protein BAE44_0008320 [Dichanthelium oligosanthes]
MVVEGSALAAQLKSQVSEVRVTPASEGASCVVSVTVEYERLDGAPLAPEDQAKLVKGYLGIVKRVEEYLVTHPGEFACTFNFARTVNQHICIGLPLYASADPNMVWLASCKPDLQGGGHVLDEEFWSDEGGGPMTQQVNKSK